MVGKSAFVGTTLLKFRSFLVELWNETSIILGTRNGTKAENRERGTSEDCSSLGEVRAAKLYTAVNLHPSAAIRSSLGYRKKKSFSPQRPKCERCVRWQRSLRIFFLQLLW